MTFSPPPEIGPPRSRPTRLTVSMILIWVLDGIAGLYAAYALLMVLVQLVFGPINSLPAGHPAAKYGEDMFWASLPYLQIPQHAAQLVVSAALFYFSIQTFRGLGGVRERFRGALILASIFAILKFLLMSFLQYRVGQVLMQYREALVSMGGPPPPGAEKVMGSVVLIAIVAGLALSVAVLGVKLFLYLYTRHVLDAPEVRAYLCDALPSELEGTTGRA